MVLSQSSADPASGQDWLAVERALTLARDSVLVLIADAQPARLPALVRALLGVAGDMRVCMRADDLLDIEPGSVVLLQVRAEDISWLNGNRPLFANRRLRAVLWAEGDGAQLLHREAPDFFDWISSVVYCTSDAPEFAVRGLVNAREVPLGVAWHGPGLEAAIARSEPEAVIERVSAHAEFDDIVQAARRPGGLVPGWLVIDGVERAHQFKHARLALREVRRMGRCVLFDPRCPTPGFLAVDARMATWDEAVARLRAHGDAGDIRSLAAIAALLGLESSALDLAAEALERGISSDELYTLARAESDPGAQLARVAWQRGWLTLDAATLAAGSPCVVRGLAGSGDWQRARREVAERVQATLAVWSQGEGVTLSNDKLAVWEVALFWHQQRGIGSLVAAKALARVDDNRGAELILRDEVARIAAGELTNDDQFMVYIELARVLTVQRQLQEAEQFARRALVLVDTFWPDNEYHRSICLERLGGILEQQGRFQEAMAHYRDALQRARNADDREDVVVAVIAAKLGKTLDQLGQHDEAESRLRWALETIDRAYPGHYQRRGILAQFAQSLDAQNKLDEAEVVWRETVEIYETAEGPGSPDTIRWKFKLGMLLLRTGKHAEASDVLARTIADIEEHLGTGHPYYGPVLSSHVIALVAQSRLAEAETTAQRGLTHLQAHLQAAEEEIHGYTVILNNLVQTQVLQGKFPQAEKNLRDLLSLEERGGGVTQVTLLSLAAALKAQGKHGEAGDLLARAQARPDE